MAKIVFPNLNKIPEAIKVPIPKQKKLYENLATTLIDVAPKQWKDTLKTSGQLISNTGATIVQKAPQAFQYVKSSLPGRAIKQLVFTPLQRTGQLASDAVQLLQSTNKVSGAPRQMLNGGWDIWQGAKNLFTGAIGTGKDTADLSASLVGTATSWLPLLAGGAALGQVYKFYKNSDFYKDRKRVRDSKISYDLIQKIRKKVH